MVSQIEIINVKNLSKSFSKKRVVNNLQLTVNKGEIYGFLGPNGSGKTTTLRMLCGLLVPDSGIGHCLGYDVVKDSKMIKKNVGYMTQKFSLYEDLTILENLEFIANIYLLDDQKNKIINCLKQLGLFERRNQLAGSLSGGWKQRVALAACLLHEPKLLLLDEPTAGVDPKARREFWDKIYELSQIGITTLVSTHYMDEAERCTRLAYIAYGDLLVSGTIPEIIKQVSLTTWKVSGKSLPELAKILKNVEGVSQTVFFGEALHISGYDKDKLNHALKPHINNLEYSWELINSSLEDVFISLVK